MKKTSTFLNSFSILNFLFILQISLLSQQVIAQVGINTTNPSENTWLHISENQIFSTTNLKGILIPRLNQIQINSFIPDSSDNSLMVFNTDEDCYNYWHATDAEWKSLCGQLGRATFQINCSTLEAHGNYTSTKPLTTDNYISMEIDVTKAGSYEITATTANANGYAFHYNGVFLNTGLYTIQIPGQGTPTEPTLLNGAGDPIKIQTNGTLVCESLNIKVEDVTIIPEYIINCSQISIKGKYTVNQMLTSSNELSLQLTAPLTATGATYHIYSNTVNGYQFEGKGILIGGNQTITLKASGQPQKNGTDTFFLTTNSSLGATSCTFVVKVAARKMKVLGLANNDNSYNLGRSGNLLYQVLNNTNYFDNNQNSIYLVNGFDFMALSNLNNAQINQFQNYKPDIVLVQYNFTANADQQDFLAQYVANGGVLIYCTDGDGQTAARNTAARNLSRKILNDDGMEVTGSDSNNLMTIQNTDNLISNGPFLNLVGKSMGRDAGNNFRFEIVNFPFDKANIIAYGDDNNNTIRAFVAKNTGYAFFGDGAPFAANQGTQAYNWPAKFNTLNGITVAIPNTYGAVTSYNSHLFLNLMAWAVDYAQKNNP